MDSEKLKRVLAGMSIVALVATSSIAITGCKTTEQKAGQSS